MAKGLDNEAIDLFLQDLTKEQYIEIMKLAEDLDLEVVDIIRS